jgi:hypothetical protein
MPPPRGRALDVVVVTNMGYPADTSVYQSVKGMSVAAGASAKAAISSSSPPAGASAVAKRPLPDRRQLSAKAPRRDLRGAPAAARPVAGPVPGPGSEEGRRAPALSASPEQTRSAHLEYSRSIGKRCVSCRLRPGRGPPRLSLVALRPAHRADHHLKVDSNVHTDLWAGLPAHPARGAA